MNLHREQSIFEFIGHSMHSFRLLLERKFVDVDININLIQFIILNIIYSREEIILEELSKILEKDKSAIFRHLRYLKEMDCVVKVIDKRDNRRKVLILTEKGISLLKQARNIEKQLNEQITAELNSNEIVVLKKALSSMNIQAVNLLKK